MTQVNPTVGTPATPGFYTQFANQVETFVDESGGDGEKVARKPNVTDTIIHVTPLGDDANDGLSWGTAKLSIQAAMIAGAGGTVQLSGGTFTDLVDIDAQIALRGTVVRGAGRGVTIIKPAVAGSAFTIGGASSNDHGYMRFSDFSIDGRNSGGTKTLTNGFFLKDALALWENVEVMNCTGSGWAGDPSQGTRNYCEWHHCVAESNDGFGLDGRTNNKDNNWLVIGGRYADNGDTGIWFGGTNCRAFGAAVSTNDQWGFRVGGNGCSIVDCIIEDNARTFGTWAATTAYSVGDRRNSTDTVTNPDRFMCTVAGTSGGSEPTWKATAPDVTDTLTDGSVTWLNVGISGSGDGAGIDDTGSSRLLVRNLDYTSQAPLGAGECILEYPSSVGGGHRHMLFGGGADAMRSGLSFTGGVGVGRIKGFDPRRTDAALELSGQGAGRVQTVGGLRSQTAVLATSATTGFLGIPRCAGVPSGTPTAETGVVPMVYDTTNNHLYIYNGGWKKTTVFA